MSKTYFFIQVRIYKYTAFLPKRAEESIGTLFILDFLISSTVMLYLPTR